MKQLEKLVTKKVTSPETVKGGKFCMISELEADDQTRTTENHASWNGQHWVTDSRNDPK